MVEALEDREMFSEYVEAEDKGLIRLLSHNFLTQINGGGSYYSFSDRTHEYGSGSDVSFGNGDFSVGFQVVRKDDSDGSVILKWKTIKKFPVVFFTGQ